MATTTTSGTSIHQRIRHRIERSAFGRNVAVLAGGAALGQFFAVAMTPVLTRLYTPAQFGVFEIWVGLMGLIAVLSTLRYPEAVPLSSTNDEASATAGAGVVSSIAIFFVSLGAVALGRHWVADLIGISELSSILWLLPFATLFHGFNFTMQGWATRAADYSGLARTKVRQSVAGVMTQIVLGLTPLGLWGLAAGSAVGQGAGSASLARRASLSGINWTEMRNMKSVRRSAWRYRRFPMFRAPATLINAVAVAAPPLALAIAYNKEVAGLYALIVRLLGLPTTLIGQSTMQVFYSEGSRLVRTNSGSLRALLSRTAFGLAALSTPGLLVAGVLAPWLIPFALGAEWTDSARFLQLLAPMYLMRLVVTPVTGTFSILELQRSELAIEMLKTGLIVGAIIAAATSDWTPNVAVGLISGAGVAGFGASFMLARRAARRFDSGDLVLAHDRTNKAPL